jgi:UDP-N-acetylmuramate--alanine ligase
MEGGYRFDIRIPGGSIQDCSLPIGGLHNIENAVGAVAVAHRLGIDAAAIRSALGSFRGVKRRFETIYRNEGALWIDDYAHHPEELRALVQGVRDLYPGHHLTLIFQPHLYTRTRDLADAFGEVLSLADESFLLPIYPARELPIDGVSSEMIRSASHPQGFTVFSKAAFEDWVVVNWSRSGSVPRVLVSAGAGDIDQLYLQILKRMGQA